MSKPVSILILMAAALLEAGGDRYAPRNTCFWLAASGLVRVRSAGSFLIWVDREQAALEFRRAAWTLCGFLSSGGSSYLRHFLPSNDTGGVLVGGS